MDRFPNLAVPQRPSYPTLHGDHENYRRPLFLL